MLPENRSSGEAAHNGTIFDIREARHTIYAACHRLRRRRRAYQLNVAVHQAENTECLARVKIHIFPASRHNIREHHGSLRAAGFKSDSPYAFRPNMLRPASEAHVQRPCPAHQQACRSTRRGTAHDMRSDERRGPEERISRRQELRCRRRYRATDIYAKAQAVRAHIASRPRSRRPGSHRAVRENTRQDAARRPSSYNGTTIEREARISSDTEQANGAASYRRRHAFYGC